jgi:hypothetical protein
VNDPEEMTEGTAEALEEMLSPRVDISSIAGETNEEKLNVIVFELYKEALSVVNLAAHILNETSTAKGGWPRNQAICAGLLIRISKFMLVVIQLSAKDNRAEVVSALNRSIMESAFSRSVSPNSRHYPTPLYLRCSRQIRIVGSSLSLRSMISSGTSSSSPFSSRALAAS